MTTASLETETESRAIRNAFMTALNKGFRKLNASQRELAIDAMREVGKFSRPERCIVPPRCKASISKEMSPAEKQAARNAADAANAKRIEDVYDFLNGFLPSSVARMMSDALEPNVEGLVAITARNDENFTLIVE